MFDTDIDVGNKTLLSAIPFFINFRDWRKTLMMRMSMHIGAKAAKALRMDRDVREEDMIMDLTGFDLLKPREVVFDGIEIMIAKQEAFVPIQAIKDAVFDGMNAPVHGDIPQVVDVVVGFDDRVPTINHRLVHIIHRSKRARGRSICEFERMHHVRVVKMGI